MSRALQESTIREMAEKLAKGVKPFIPPKVVKT